MARRHDHLRHGRHATERALDTAGCTSAIASRAAASSPGLLSAPVTDSVYFHQNKMLSVGVQMVLQNFRRYGIDEKQVVPIEGYFVDSMPKLRASLMSRGERRRDLEARWRYV